MGPSDTLVIQNDRRGAFRRKQLLRLPIIVPKDNSSPSTNSSNSGHLDVVGLRVPPRARLPSRSRTGCRTCRTRKVKCDERKPICGQCSRFRHCDYSPRVAFRDDTPRVLERMQEVAMITGSVWDANSQSTTDTNAGPGVVDDLPPFALLTTDGDREKKAESSGPGTYNVVVNQASFHHLPEYNNDPEVERELSSPLRRADITTSLAINAGRESEGIPVPGDPNTIVLPRFEDVVRRGRFSSKDHQLPISPTAKDAIIKTKEQDGVAINEEISSVSYADKMHQDSRYLIQFRNVVWSQLVPTELDRSDGMVPSSVGVLEVAAKGFLPLYHAMLAVAALSLARWDGSERLEALQHYQQALPALQSSLRSSEDLCSDGAFLTHFLLLVYEIAAAEAGHSNLWSSHLSTLLRIALLRRNVFGRERFPFVVWRVCKIDLDAIFSGAGCGEFVASILESDIIPPPSFHLYPLGLDGTSVLYADELDSLSTALQLDDDATMLAVRLALLAHEFRQDTSINTAHVVWRSQVVRIRQSRIFELQEALRQLWAALRVIMIDQPDETLPSRPRQLYEHAATLSGACLIFSHTSMWPGQRQETSPDHDTEIAVASSQILHMTRKALAEGRPGCWHLVFPTFIAGFASMDRAQRKHALDLIHTMEKSSIGRNAAVAREALAAVYEKQNERVMETGQSLDVDWMEVMREQDLMVVNFSL